MLVCQCNLITTKDIEDIVVGILDEDPWQLVVPAQIYREAGKRGQCCGCVPNIVDIIQKVTENYHLMLEGNAANLVDVRARLKGLPKSTSRMRNGGDNERQRNGYRAA
ncbi:(2Fe-2S)-binding protein [Pelagibacterium xiamenense]|uniref:(2Fe-2S)-binding protein n=1 Tax=Pelagibacterium xiamenense TaxID=2901140 RepID=UPI001E5E054D|nr:(2Fe-2S)-binding protein [Pelagibacterium xiamenense]MCD7060740.1 (2Fe-2S)-binding protein [Pelagibacterium xiamenense]